MERLGRRISWVDITDETEIIIAIYLTSIINPSFYYPCVAVGNFLAVAGFLAGRDSEKERVYAFFSESSRSANFASRAC